MAARCSIIGSLVWAIFGLCLLGLLVMFVPIYKWNAFVSIVYFPFLVMVSGLLYFLARALVGENQYEFVVGVFFGVALFIGVVFLAEV